MPKQNKLKALLAENQLTMRDFALSVGMKPDTFYKKLSGKSEFTVAEALRICAALNDSAPREVFMT